MASPPRRGPDGTVRVAINGLIHGEPWANVFWANLTGGTTATQAALDAWTTSFYSQYGIVWQAFFTPDVTIANAQSTLFQPGETALHSLHVGTVVGNGGSPFVNDNSASRVISWNTSVYWRGGKPRTYLPGLYQADSTDGKTLTTATVNSLVTAAGNWHSAINALSATGITQTQHGFVSFKSGGVDRIPSVFFPINGGTAHHRIGSQRGRLGSWVP